MFKVSANPHVRDSISTSKVMLYVIIGLLPTSIYGVYHFGLRALLHILIGVISAVAFEYIFNRIVAKQCTIGDLSAVITGLLLALNLPVSVPLWMPVLGSLFAIVVVKGLFGGLGQNFMNPALAARCFLLISFSKLMTNFSTDLSAVDAVSVATPLQCIRDGSVVSLKDMFIGNTYGTIGETSALCILIGAAIMLCLGVIDLYIPATYIGSFAVCIFLFKGCSLSLYDIGLQLVGGGLMLGAFFMATDYVTRPISIKGQVVYGIFLGFMTAIFRCFAPSAEGVSYAIIIGNLMVPLIEKITVPAPFGLAKKGGRA